MISRYTFYGRLAHSQYGAIGPPWYLVLLGAPSPGRSLAKYSAEKTKYTDISQPPNQRDDAILTLNDARPTLNASSVAKKNLGLAHAGLTQAHLCDIPFCNISRNTCAMPHNEGVLCDTIAIGIARYESVAAAPPRSRLLDSGGGLGAGRHSHVSLGAAGTPLRR